MSVPELWTRRLSREIRHLGTPVVLLVGWPGLGRRDLLAHLAEDPARQVAPIPGAVLARTADLLKACEGLRLEGAGTFVVEAGQDVDWNHLASVLLPGEQLLAATNVYQPTEALEAWGRVGVLLPEDLLLREDEGEQLAQIEGVSGGASSRLWSWSDGWLEPLRLAARCDAEDADSALDSPGLSRFMEERVLAPLGDALVDELSQLARAFEVQLQGGADARDDPPDYRLTTLLSDAGRVRRLPLIRDGRPWLPGPLAQYLRTRRPRFSAVQSFPGGRRNPIISVDPREPAGSRTVRLSLLGEPRVALERDGVWSELSFPYRLVASVLAYISTSPELRVAKDVLVADLWPDTSASSVRSQLHPAVSKLRRLLDPERELATPGVELVAGVYRLSALWTWSIDCLDLEAQVRSCLGLATATSHEDLESETESATMEPDRPGPGGDDDGSREARGTLDLESQIGVLEGAWRLYGGPFMRGFSARWVQRKREHYERVYERMLRSLASAYESVERWDDAEDAYRSLLINDPSQEDVHVSLMKLYSRRGRLDLTRRQWERLCKVLLEELGVPPMDTTLREYRRLLG